MGGWAHKLLTSGLGQLCGPCLWQGHGEAERREAGTGLLAGLPAPTPPRSFGFLVPAHAQPTASSLQTPPPTSLPSLRAQPCPLGGCLLQTPAAPALALGPQVEEMELEGHLRCLKKKKETGGGNGSPLQYSCLENFHGQRSLVGYSPWCGKDLIQLSN